MCRLGDQRVEWMYQGGFAAQEDAAKKKEEYLLGKAVDKLPDHGPAEAVSRVSTLHHAPGVNLDLRLQPSARNNNS